jgi:D-aminoacyl-tRNA deacylase
VDITLPIPKGSFSNMKAVIQRVTQSQVEVDGSIVGKIGKGLMILLGIGHDDLPETVHAMAQKICQLRIFSDTDGKMNLSLVDIQGEALVVSQFTLYADCRKGRRPSFVGAAPPDRAKMLYEEFCDAFRKQGVTVATGIFQADMQVALVNDGPVTIVLEL